MMNEKEIYTGIPLFYPRQFYFWWCDNEQWTLNLIRRTSVSLFAGQIKYFTISCVRVSMCNKVVLPKISPFRTIHTLTMQIDVYSLFHFCARRKIFCVHSIQIFLSTFDRYYLSTIRRTHYRWPKKGWFGVDEISLIFTRTCMYVFYGNWWNVYVC